MCDTVSEDVQGTATSTSSATGTAQDSSCDDASVTLSFKQRLQTAMNQSANAPAPIASDSLASDKKLMNAIKSEMALFESTGKRGSFLQAAYSNLLSIPPTSVEAERAFSAAGLFLTKLRSRLGDQSIDTLCFLRAFYGQKMKD